MQEDDSKMTDHIEKQLKEEAIAVFRKIMAEIGETPEFKKAKNEAIQKSLSGWAGHSMFKKMVSNRTIKKIEHELLDARVSPKTDIREMALWEDLGKLITLASKFLALKDRTNPKKTAELLETPLKKILMNADFGNIYEMVAASEGRKLSTQKMVQDVMAQFPTKAGIFPAIKLKQANTNLKKKNLALKNMADMPPEMLVSTMANLVNTLIESKEIGMLANNISELIRKLHTGSVILGDGGKSLTETMLAAKLVEAMSEINPALFTKAMVGLAGEIEAGYSALLSAMAENQDMLSHYVASYGQRKNSKIRCKHKKAALLEEFIDTENGPGAVEKSLEDLDMQEVGEHFNTWLRIINQMHESQPNIGLSAASSLFSVIDWDELQAAAQWVIPDMVESVKPVAGAVMPALINGFCELLKPAPGEDSGELDEALSNLRHILLPSGGEMS